MSLASNGHQHLGAIVDPDLVPAIGLALEDSNDEVVEQFVGDHDRSVEPLGQAGAVSQIDTMQLPGCGAGGVGSFEAPQQTRPDPDPASITRNGSGDRSRSSTASSQRATTAANRGPTSGLVMKSRATPGAPVPAA